jgi:hypothetical protein
MICVRDSTDEFLDSSNYGAQINTQGSTMKGGSKSERLTRRKGLERWENKIGNCEVTPQAIWPIAKSLMNTDGQRAPPAIHGPSGLKFHPLEKANAIAVSKISSHPMTCATATMNGG